MECTDYCLAAVREGSQANERVLGGLRAYGFGDVDTLDALTVVSSPGVPPRRTRALRCRRGSGPDVCVKFYDASSEQRLPENGLDGLRCHVRAVRTLRGVVPVADIIGVEEDDSVFGLPALVTAFAGDTLAQAIVDMPGAARMKLVDDIADAAAALTRVAPRDVGLSISGPADVNDLFHAMCCEDGDSYAEWLQTDGTRVAGDIRDLVARSNLAFATNRPELNTVSLIHRDPSQSNIAVRDGALSAFLDWDKAGGGSPQEDLGKLISCLLMLPVPETERLEMVPRLLARYHSATALGPAEMYEASLVHALSHALHRLVWCRRLEVAWSVSVILDALAAGCPENSGLWSDACR